MTSRTILNVGDRQQLVKLIESYKFPFTVNLTKGKDRSIEQNKLQRLWLLEIAEQLGENTPEGYRAYCKLHHGVPILRAESEDFCQAYDRHIRALPYETKLAYMAVPLDFPVTRLFTTAQMSQYLDAIHADFTSQGVRLTDPEERGQVA